MNTLTAIRSVPKPGETGKRKPKPLSQKKALELTLGLVREEIQRLAPQANLNTLYGVTGAEVMQAVRERDQWREVQQLFERWLEQVDG